MNRSYFYIIAIVSLLAANQFKNGQSVATAASDESQARQDAHGSAQKEMAKADLIIHEYAYSQKKEYVKQMKGELKMLNKQLDELKKLSKKAKSRNKREADKQIASMKTTIKKLNSEVDSIQDTSEYRWDEVKSNFKVALASAKDSISKSRQWMSDKIAP